MRRNLDHYLRRKYHGRSRDRDPDLRNMRGGVVADEQPGFRPAALDEPALGELEGEQLVDGGASSFMDRFEKRRPDAELGGQRGYVEGDPGVHRHVPRDLAPYFRDQPLRECGHRVLDGIAIAEVHLEDVAGQRVAHIGRHRSDLGQQGILARGDHHHAVAQGQGREEQLHSLLRRRQAMDAAPHPVTLVEDRGAGHLLPAARDAHRPVDAHVDPVLEPVHGGDGQRYPAAGRDGRLQELRITSRQRGAPRRVSLFNVVHGERDARVDLGTQQLPEHSGRGKIAVQAEDFRFHKVTSPVMSCPWSRAAPQPSCWRASPSGGGRRPERRGAPAAR